MYDEEITTVVIPEDIEGDYFSIDRDNPTGVYGAFMVDKRGKVIETVIENATYAEALHAVAERFEDYNDD